MFLIFTPNLGEMIKYDEHILQMVWSHQVVYPIIYKVYTFQVVQDFSNQK